MFAIIIDENNYLQDYSEKYRKPGSIVVDAIPEEEDPEKLHCYQYINDEFVFDAEKWAEIEAIRAENARVEELQQNIDALKESLNSTDYKILKCYEYSLNNLDLPYDPAALHAERQDLRDQINELEGKL